jgi:hypothetical protein
MKSDIRSVRAESFDRLAAQREWLIFLQWYALRLRLPFALSWSKPGLSDVEGGEMEDSFRSCFDKLSMNGASFALVRIIVLLMPPIGDR